MDKEISKLSAECKDYYKFGEFGKAEAAWGKLLEKAEGYEEKQLALLYNNRGHAKYMQVEFYTAKDDFDAAIELDSGLASAYYNRATILYRMGSYLEAIPDFQRSVDLDPENHEFHEGLKSCQDFLAEKKPCDLI